MAISIATLAARSYRSVSYVFLPSSLFLLPLFFLLLLSLPFLSLPFFSLSFLRPSTTLPALSALSAAERQMSRILCAASISPSGHWTSSPRISFRLPLSNHHTALPKPVCEPARWYRQGQA